MSKEQATRHLRKRARALILGCMATQLEIQGAEGSAEWATMGDDGEPFDDRYQRIIYEEAERIAAQWRRRAEDRR